MTLNVRIFEQSKPATQSGRATAGKWILEYEPPTRREPESLMGWTASGDTLNQVRLNFKNAEEAVAFAKGKGWTCSVHPSRKRKVKPRNYGDNFKYEPPPGDQ